MKASNVISYSLLIVICISQTISLPVTRMRVCVQSSDPTRLQSQCVYCNNRMFSPTVRQCTGYTYLPANLSVEEAFCLVRNCRRQTPNMRPEPFYGTNVQSSIDTVNNVNNVNTNEDDYSDSEPLYAETPPNRPSNSQSNGSTNGSSKRRPPAPFIVGKPQRPVRPFLFGKRSTQDTYRHQLRKVKQSVFPQIKTYFAKSSI